MKSIRGRIVSLIVLTACCTSALGQIDENFDDYNVGNIDGQGPWVDFGGVNLSEVSTDQARSGDKSLKLTLSDANPNPADIVGYGSDVFLDMAQRVRSGVYELSYWTYVPGEFNGSNYAFFSEGQVGAGQFDFGTQLIAAADIETFIFFDGAQAFGLPIARDGWVKAEQIIDFDNNLVQVTYGGDLLYIGPWDPDPAPGIDFPQFRGVNFWVQDVADGQVPTGSMYIDDVLFQQLVPEPSSLVLVLCGLMTCVGNARRLRK